MIFRKFLLLFLTIRKIINQPPTNENTIPLNAEGVDSSIYEIQWCGNNENNDKFDQYSEEPIKLTALLLTYNGTLYSSKHHGLNLESIQPRFFNALSEINKISIDESYKKYHKGYITRLILQESIPGFLIIMGFTEGISFYSFDCGETITAFRHDKYIKEFIPSKTKDNWWLGVSKIPCKEFSKVPCSNSKGVFLSKDYGSTWNLLISSVTEVSWASQTLVDFSEIPESRIIVAHKESNKSRIIYSDDFFIKTKLLSENAKKFFTTSNYLFTLERAEEDSNSLFKLNIGRNVNNDYKIFPIKIPIERIKDHSFTILESAYGHVFLNINHYYEGAKFGNIYVSDFSGISYSLSLLHNVRDSNGYCDFSKVEGMEGVYISNIYESSEAEKAKLYLENDDKSYKLSYDRLENFKKSVISFDRGASWQPIRAPEYDLENKPIQCSGECSLHLRGYTDKMSNPIYSNKNAIGIIIAVGNIGIYLSTRENEINTYFSRDGGHNWYELRKGSHIYEIGDHGGIIVMAEDSVKTQHILYSWDEGLTWEKVQFSNQKMDITNIVMEPNNKASSFILYGNYFDKKKGTLEGIVIPLDFSDIHERFCKGSNDLDSKDSDYEDWVPAWYHSSKCILGKKVRYIRRKRASKCFNGPSFNNKIEYEYCDCEEEDWECDFGFYKPADIDKCLPLEGVGSSMDEYNSPPKNCKGFYNVTRGYRKVPGDVCELGVDKGPKLVPCPDYLYKKNSFKGNEGKEVKKGSSSSFFRIFFVVLLVGFIFYFRENVFDIIYSIKEKISYRRNIPRPYDRKYDRRAKKNLLDDEEY